MVHTFKLHDVAQSRDNPRLFGTISYIEDDIIYIETAQGAEHEFDASGLVPYKSPAQLAEKQAEVGRQKKTKDESLAAEILERLPGIIVVFTETAFSSIANSLKVKGINSDSWDDCNATQKMNWVCVTTDIDMLKWIDAHRNNTISTLSLVAIAAIGDAVTKIIETNNELK